MNNIQENVTTAAYLLIIVIAMFVIIVGIVAYSDRKFKLNLKKKKKNGHK